MAITKNALNRRYKKHLKNRGCSFFVSCPVGFENILKKQIKNLSLPIVKETIGGIETTGKIEELYSLNMIPVASRVLMRITTIKALSYPELFNKASKIKWELYMGNSDDVCIKVTAIKSKLRHTKNISKTIYESINKYYENFEHKLNFKQESILNLFIRAENDEFTISIDTSGNQLHKRGYKLYSSEAPIRENIASAIILNSPFKNKHEIIIDPCCGSGTMLFEHALCTQNINASRMRHFAFEQFYFFNKNLYLRKTETLEQNNTLYIGYDIDKKNINASIYNSKKISDLLKNEFNFHQQDSTYLKNNNDKKGLIISNLPYGKRINAETINSFYIKFSKNLSKEFENWDCIFVTTKEHEHKLPVKVLKQKTVKNSNISVSIIYGIIKTYK